MRSDVIESLKEGEKFAKWDGVECVVFVLHRTQCSLGSYPPENSDGPSILCSPLFDVLDF
jgi:hypothetical protein